MRRRNKYRGEVNPRALAKSGILRIPPQIICFCRRSASVLVEGGACDDIDNQLDQCGRQLDESGRQLDARGRQLDERGRQLDEEGH